MTYEDVTPILFVVGAKRRAGANTANASCKIKAGRDGCRKAEGQAAASLRPTKNKQAVEDINQQPLARQYLLFKM